MADFEGPLVLKEHMQLCHGHAGFQDRNAVPGGLEI